MSSRRKKRCKMRVLSVVCFCGPSNAVRPGDIVSKPPLNCRRKTVAPAAAVYLGRSCDFLTTPGSAQKRYHPNPHAVLVYRDCYLFCQSLSLEVLLCLVPGPRIAAYHCRFLVAIFLRWFELPVFDTLMIPQQP